MPRPPWPERDDALPEFLCRVDWLDTGAEHPIRYIFRKDGSGYCDREAGPGARPVFEKLLWKVSPADAGRATEGVRSVELGLKFAHARGWLAVEARLTDEPLALTLALDPWVLALEERRTAPQRLLADTGPSLDDG